MSKMNGKPYLSVKSEKRRIGTRMCLICGEEYEADYSVEGSICPTCIKEFGIKRRKKGEYPCDKRKICKKCAHRVRLTGAGTDSHHICNCLIHTGQIRDLTSDDKHCGTFEQMGKKKYEDNI